MTAAKPIAAVQGGTSAEIQRLLQAFVAELQPATRIAGVIEEDPDGDGRLRSLTDGRAFPIFQDLGSSSCACGLDAGSVASACEAVRRDVAAGCDLLVLSKFGKLEAERSGLAGAFTAAVETRTPILTSVGSKYDAPWRAFAAPLFVMLRPELAAVRQWWAGAALYGERAAGPY
jgi:hypothetical protein